MNKFLVTTTKGEYLVKAWTSAGASQILSEKGFKVISCELATEKNSKDLPLFNNTKAKRAQKESEITDGTTIECAGSIFIVPKPIALEIEAITSENAGLKDSLRKAREANEDLISDNKKLANRVLNLSESFENQTEEIKTLKASNSQQSNLEQIKVLTVENEKLEKEIKRLTDEKEA